jgi:hypothetical protein
MCNNSCSGKAIGIAHSEYVCVCVATMQCACAVLSSMACLASPYLSTLPQKWNDFRKKKSY